MIPPITARRVVAENRFCRFVEEDLTDRHGQPYTYYQLEAVYDAVIVVPILPDGRLLLERVYRHPYRRTMLEFPAGGIELGEDPCAAAGRELEEETGWRAGALTLLGSHEALPGLLRMRLHLVLATNLVPGAAPRHEAMELITLAELAEADAWSEAEQPGASSFLTLGLYALLRWRARSR